MTKLERAIEACWLAAAGLVPLAIVPESWAVGYIEGPKVFLLRSIALLLVVLLAARWSMAPASAGGAAAIGAAGLREALVSGVRRLRGQPIALAATAVLLATVVSTALSPIANVSVFGVDPGRDSYGLFSLASYMVVFAAVATQVRTGAQVRRLLWVLTASSMMLGLYGIEQHFGIDPFLKDAHAQARVEMSFGNPVFAGTYLLMTIPLTLALWQSRRYRYGAITHAVMGAGLITLQVTALAFTVSRGPIISLAVALGVFLAAMAFIQGRKAVGGPALSIAIAVAVAVVLGFVPVSDDIAGANGRTGTSTGALVDRFTSEAAFAPSGGVAARISIWSVAVRAYGSVPWIDTDEHPEMPSLGPAVLRPVVGYGPDTFRYAFSLQGKKTRWSIPWHAHNFILHTALELGALGVLAYAGLALATGLALWRLVRAARRGAMSPWLGLVVAGIAGVFVGRLLDQMVGKAQISDLMQAWLMAGLILALIRMPASEWLEPLRAEAVAAPKPQGRQQRPGRQRRAASVGVQGLTHPLRIAAATLLAVTVAVFWLQAVVSHVSATSLAGRAIAASEAGQFAKAGEHLLAAVDRSPTATVPRTLLAEALLDAARTDSNPVERKAKLRSALRLVEDGVDRNPVDYRAWRLAAEITFEQALADPTFADDAVAATETAAALLPGLRAPGEQLGRALLLAGEFERAVEVARYSRELASRTDPRGYLLSFIESQALQGLGRTDEAFEIALDLAERRSLVGIGKDADAYANAVLLSESDRPDAPTLEEALAGWSR